ncbi:MAG TPA: sialidase family protein, partial [Thermoanaerobaculia bacterium]|nr:sialidase family protein [Thermoanaerobaculia bacterium]
MPVQKSRLFHLAFIACLLVLMGLPVGAWAKKPPAAKNAKDDRMSAMGHLAARARAAVEATQGHLLAKGAADGNCGNEPDCEGEDQDGPAGGQAEVSIAVDSSGQHVVIGFNDTRGFALNPTSVSGYMYSDDGGVTFVDGGQLPSPGTDVIGTTRLPQVFGDPEIKYLGSCNFVYASILIKKFSATRTAQTMGVHRSTDCGHTWTGPFEVTAATNPNGLTTASGTPRDAADKEFMDVDSDTGRVVLSWSNFTPVAAGGVEIATTYSDNILTATPPTWTPRAIVAATAVDGQSSIPRFAAHGSSNAYVAWRRFPFPGSFFGNGNTIGFSRSTDNGASWSAPIDLGPEFFTMDQVLGNDRVHTAPGLAVDTSSSRYAGNVYVVYADNDNHDGADVVFQRSTDGGLTFTTPLRLDSRPGNDRAQWFPWVTVDSSTGRVWVFYYDQGIATSGDRTETTVTYSDDGGSHWSAPAPLTDRPFQGGWGNDTGQPNLGDYNEAVAQNGELFSAYALASRPPLGFADGQPSS